MPAPGETALDPYRKHKMAEGDGPPVGLLLCRRKNHTLMEYALAGMDGALFISPCQLELPHEGELEKLLEEELRQRRGGEGVA